MDSKLDSNKDEKSNVTENDASKAKTSRNGKTNRRARI